jgi:UDP-N-acetylmuramyl tripeptide synthase
MTIEPIDDNAGAAQPSSPEAALDEVRTAAQAPELPLPFQDSRRLTGPNLYFSSTGAVLETAADLGADEALIAAWRERVQTVAIALGCPVDAIVAHRHATGTALAISAPIDQLYTATEVNEWAFCSSIYFALPEEARAEETRATLLSDPTQSAAMVAPTPIARRDAWFYAPGHAAVWDDASALYTLRKLSAQEHHPHLIALLHAARAHGLPALLDDEQLSLGEGAGSRSWPADALPAIDAVPWTELHAIPVALVTGSNGKTTTTRLLAAMLEASGLRCGYSSTDGVFCNGLALESGDFSGPMGARAVLRHRDVEAAVLETARGGILRRGLAVDHAQAAIVTNISADHFGEYGIHDLDGLADAKLVLARAIDSTGTLVLNADDPTLVNRSRQLSQPVAWFAFDANHPLLVEHRSNEGNTCGIAAGRLVLHAGKVHHDLGRVVDMPLTMQGAARYNIANIAGAALLAYALEVSPATIALVLETFGTRNADNPGRLMRWHLGGVDILLDYAHNPEGLRGLLSVARSLRSQGRLALILGQAGNREDEDIRKLADVAADFHPDLIVLKDIQSFLRGRAPGEIAALMRDELLRKSIPDQHMVTRLDEVEAARAILEWSHPGDVLVLPIHDSNARNEVVGLLDNLHASQWLPGTPLPNA